MQKARGHPGVATGAPTACKYTVSQSRYLTFPSRYYALSVTCSYLVLDDGAPGFPQGVSDPVVLGSPLELIHISPTGLSPTLADLPRSFGYMNESHIEVPQPREINLSV